MARQRAWCPRCDELRSARPGAPCPACSSTLLRLPGEPRPTTRGGWRAAAAERLRALLPAGRSLAVGLAVAAVVAVGFAAGRATRTTPSAGPVAAAPTETTGDARGPATGGTAYYNWTSRPQGKLTLTLQRIEVRQRGSSLTVSVDGLPRGERLAALTGVSVTDKDGRQLIQGGPVQAASAADNGGGSEAEVLLRGVVEPLAAVAAVTVQGVFLADVTTEEAMGTLVDPGLPPAFDTTPAEVPPATCPGCRLAVRCTSCATMEVAAFDYRRRDVVILLAPKGPRARSVLANAQPEVTIGNAATDLQPTVSSAPDGTVAVRFAAEALGGERDRREFLVSVRGRLEREVTGPWRMSSP